MAFCVRCGICGESWSWSWKASGHLGVEEGEEEVEWVLREVGGQSIGGHWQSLKPISVDCLPAAAGEHPCTVTVSVSHVTCTRSQKTEYYAQYAGYYTPAWVSNGSLIN